MNSLVLPLTALALLLGFARGYAQQYKGIPPQPESTYIVLRSTGAEDIASSGEKAVSTHGVESGSTTIGRPSAESATYSKEVRRDTGVDPLKVK